MEYTPPHLLSMRAFKPTAEVRDIPTVASKQCFLDVCCLRACTCTSSVNCGGPEWWVRDTFSRALCAAVGRAAGALVGTAATVAPMQSRKAQMSTIREACARASGGRPDWPDVGRTTTRVPMPPDACSAAPGGGPAARPCGAAPERREERPRCARRRLYFVGGGRCNFVTSQGSWRLSESVEMSLKRY